MSNFYWFDILLIGLTLLLALRGIVSGLVKELFGLLGIVLGIFFAARWDNQAADFIKANIYDIANDDLAMFAGFLSVLIIIWVLCLLAGSVLSKLIKLSGLGFLDRLGGFIFGGAKFFCIFAVLVFCVQRVDFLYQNLTQYTQNSFTLPWLESTGAFIMNQPLVQQGIENFNANFETNTTQGE